MSHSFSASNKLTEVLNNAATTLAVRLGTDLPQLQPSGFVQVQFPQRDITKFLNHDFVGRAGRGTLRTAHGYISVDDQIMWFDGITNVGGLGQFKVYKRRINLPSVVSHVYNSPIQMRLTRQHLLQVQGFLSSISRAFSTSGNSTVDLSNSSYGFEYAGSKYDVGNIMWNSMTAAARSIRNQFYDDGTNLFPKNNKGLTASKLSIGGNTTVGSLSRTSLSIGGLQKDLKWDQGYNTLQGNSASWITTLPSSSDWNSSYNTLGGYSRRWQRTYLSVLSNSATWMSTNSTVSSNSASWGSIALPRSSNWNRSYNTLTSYSAGWMSTSATVFSNSASWNSPTLSALSAGSTRTYLLSTMGQLKLDKYGNVNLTNSSVTGTCTLNSANKTLTYISGPTNFNKIDYSLPGNEVYLVTASGDVGNSVAGISNDGNTLTAQYAFYAGMTLVPDGTYSFYYPQIRPDIRIRGVSLSDKINNAILKDGTVGFTAANWNPGSGIYFSYLDGIGADGSMSFGRYENPYSLSEKRAIYLNGSNNSKIKFGGPFVIPALYSLNGVGSQLLKVDGPSIFNRHVDVNGIGSGNDNLLYSTSSGLFHVYGTSQVNFYQSNISFSQFSPTGNLVDIPRYLIVSNPIIYDSLGIKYDGYAGFRIGAGDNLRRRNQANDYNYFYNGVFGLSRDLSQNNNFHHSIGINIQNTPLSGRYVPSRTRGHTWGIGIVGNSKTLGIYPKMLQQASSADAAVSLSSNGNVSVSGYTRLGQDVISGATGFGIKMATYRIVTSATSGGTVTRNHNLNRANIITIWAVVYDGNFYYPNDTMSNSSKQISPYYDSTLIYLKNVNNLINSKQRYVTILYHG